MRVPVAALPAGMLVDRYVPGANYVNAHAVEVRAEPATVWSAVWVFLADPPVPTFAEILLAAAAVARGEGVRGTAGFEVEAEQDGKEVVLSGAHRYATYVTNLFLEPIGDGTTRVWNVSRARFSRTLAGRVYLAGVHVFHDVLVEDALRRLRRSAERMRAPVVAG